ncbi:MAG: beta-galactosidase GalB [Candidatus Cyclobacteriaceae bacterium M3_2C_046]
MDKLIYRPAIFIFLILFSGCASEESNRQIRDFNTSWYFHLGDIEKGYQPELDHSNWRQLDLPHDWSIEGAFSPNHPAGVGGGALPGGVGWYRKAFNLEESQRGKPAFIEFDGIYWNSEVWINGHYLGHRPNGYISFQYEMTPFLYYGDSTNILAVKVDNSQQPNSRWYSGSGIYRNTRLILTNPVHVDHWGTFITTSDISNQSATVHIDTKLQNDLAEEQTVDLLTSVYDQQNNLISQVLSGLALMGRSDSEISQTLPVANPQLWSVDTPHLYKAVTEIRRDGKTVDQYQTTFGIRYFDFDQQMGFSLNGEPVKIRGVCNHHDLGCLGAAFNMRAKQRQLEILKSMGVNAIRTAHNPPAPQLLDLCDQMGFIVMDEAFDEWAKGKTKYGYAQYWQQWHEKDLEDLIRRDRNHPSVFVWSVGNEILEQWDSTGQTIVRELVDIVKSLDSTRPVTAACNPPSRNNHVNKPMVLDLIGYNYAHQSYEDHPREFPGDPFIATETTSALATRDYYDQINHSDTIRRWPIRWDKPFTQGNADHTVSAYDHVSTPWGSTHRETLKIIEQHDFMAGMYVWTGFDYLGEPTPYGWPSRSSYFGIIDLAGFPKDAYYLYQSEWTDEPVLHILPHWNWNEGDTVDVWAYFNTASVELFLNGHSQGRKQKPGDEMKVIWKVPYEPGELKAIGYDQEKEILQKAVLTAGVPAALQLTADRDVITADGQDLSFITVQVVDDKGNPVPRANNLLNFELQGSDATIAGTDNGDPTSHQSFQSTALPAFNGKCLVIIQAGLQPGQVALKASSAGLKPETLRISLE